MNSIRYIIYLEAPGPRLHKLYEGVSRGGRHDDVDDLLHRMFWFDGDILVVDIRRLTIGALGCTFFLVVLRVRRKVMTPRLESDCSRCASCVCFSIDWTDGDVTLRIDWTIEPDDYKNAD